MEIFSLFLTHLRTVIKTQSLNSLYLSLCCLSKLNQMYHLCKSPHSLSKEYNPASWGFTCSEPQESDFWKHLLRFYWFFSLSIIAHEERRLWKPSCANSLRIRRHRDPFPLYKKMFSAPRCNILVPLERETLKNMAVNSFTISKVFLRKNFFFQDGKTYCYQRKSIGTVI